METPHLQRGALDLYPNHEFGRSRAEKRGGIRRQCNVMPQLGFHIGHGFCSFPTLGRQLVSAESKPAKATSRL
jgi:hypothetical protein